MSAAKVILAVALVAVAVSAAFKLVAMRNRNARLTVIRYFGPSLDSALARTAEPSARSSGITSYRYDAAGRLETV